MKIEELTLLTNDLARQRAFYAGVLNLPSIPADADLLALQTSSSRLTFRRAPADWSGFYHFAFNIPENQFREAKAWLSQRVPLIRDNTGADEFDFESWNAHAFYFYDPAGNIVEFIARHNLPNNSSATFSERSILSVSEIGIVSDSVPGTVQLLVEKLGVSVYDGQGSDTFTAVGDEHGLFIVVKRGRIWFPDSESGKPADLFLVVAVVSARSNVQHEVSGPPYVVRDI